MKKLVLLSLSAGLCLMASAGEANAQQRMKTNEMNKSRWFNAPREYQIIDERPIIKDFREAPQAPGYVDLPPGPEGFGGGYGGGGAGAMGDPGGGSASAPMQLGGPNQGYRTDSPMSGSPMPLPKSGFGRESNIPARGMGPKGPLPGVTQGVLGKMMTPKPGAGAGPASGAGNVRGRLLGGPKPAQAQSYSGGYGSGSGIGSSGSASRSEANVRGRLLNSH